MLPMLGLFAELYRGRKTTTRDAYALVEPLVDRLYPRTFTYRRGDGQDEEHPLFGDLIDAVRHAIDTEADARSSGDGSPLGSFDGRNYFPGTHARRHEMRSLSSVQSRTSLRLPSLLSRRGSSKRRLTSESPATIKARACDERGRLTSHSTSGTNSGTGDSRVSRKLVNFRTLTWQSSQGESKEDSGPPTF